MPRIPRLFRSGPAVAGLMAAFAALAVVPLMALSAQRVIVSKGPPRSTRIEQDTTPTIHYSTLEGIAIDSLHMGPLVGATILVDGTTLSATTDKEGKFRIDSIVPGDYRLALFHPLLDTLGFSIGTPPLRMGPDSLRQVIIATPSAQSVVKSACPPVKMRLGPTALMGRIINADTQAPVDSVRVTLVWTEVEAGKDIGFRRMQKVREAITDASGAYMICGVPAGITGTLQAERGDAKTAEVPLEIGDAPLNMQSLMLSLQVATDSSGLVGESEVSGRVVTEGSIPVSDARVSVQGAKGVAMSGADGSFRLSALPSGSRTLFVRRVGFTPIELAIDLTPKQPANVIVRLAKASNSLEEVKVEGAFATALKKNGYTDRKRMGMGRYLGPDDIARRQPQYFSSLFQTIPGFKVVNTSTGSAIRSSRDQNGCVTIWVDGVQFRESQGGELDNYLRPEQLMAIETYSSSTVPAEFQGVGQSSCAVIVAWTNRTVRPNEQPKKK